VFRYSMKRANKINSADFQAVGLQKLNSARTFIIIAIASIGKAL